MAPTLNPFPKLLIGLGIMLIVIGILWQFGGKVFNFGRLPGDIAVERENIRFYFPITTSLILSTILSIILYLIRHLNK